jgi:hypothetical protein
MNKTFWVTLRNFDIHAAEQIGLWLCERNISVSINASDPLEVFDGIFRYTSYSFPNDDDAMLFKLTFSNYL